MQTVQDHALHPMPHSPGPQEDLSLLFFIFISFLYKVQEKYIAFQLYAPFLLDSNLKRIINPTFIKHVFWKLKKIYNLKIFM